MVTGFGDNPGNGGVDDAGGAARLGDEKISNEFSHTLCLLKTAPWKIRQQAAITGSSAF
jgi:hypothetical protein